MTLRKGFLFATSISILITFFINTNTTRATEIESGLPAIPVKIASYDFKKDPFSLDWTFTIENKQGENKEVTTAPLSPEEKMLERWKKKQGHLWTALPKEKFTVNASAYTAAADECGKSDGITASGLKVAQKRTLACPSSFPFGTKIAIEGMGEFRCEDRGGAIKGNKVDIYMETKQEAFAFGRRNLMAEVIE
jgi:3D (Asp-Asp-Asp) domain-containing protein